MTSTSFSEPPPPTDTHSPRLERTSRYRGVCSALARTTGTDVVLWNVMFIVLAFFDGIGLFLYMLALVLIPERGRPLSLGKRLLHGPDRHLEAPDVVILVVLALVAAGNWNGGDGITFLVFVAFCLLIFSNGSVAIRIGSGRRPESPAEPDALSEPLIAPMAAPTVAPTNAFTPPPPARPRSVLSAITVGVALLVVGALLLLSATGTAGITAEVVTASALAVVGAGIVVSAWWGRAGLLLPIAILLALGLAATTVARPAIDAGVGDRTWTPTGSASFRLGVGDATLDLRNLILLPGQSPVITARVDVGHLVVIVPEAVRVTVDARARLGDVLVFGVDANGHRIAQHAVSGPEGASQVTVDASVRTGQVEVRRG